MISIVICSRNNELYNALVTNISHTIGDVQFEIIRIDNNARNIPITVAYNEGIKLALHDKLCFVHEDIIFTTRNWGLVLIKIFESCSNVGVIGVAGSKVIYNAPMSWFNAPLNFQYKNIEQLDNGKFKHEYIGFNDHCYEEVVALDGVFLAFSKSKKIVFDDTLVGFHGYDLEICLQSYNNGFKNLVINNIQLKHFSTGRLNGDWLHSIFHVYLKYYKFLPFTTTKDSKSTAQGINYLNAFIHKCFDYKEFNLGFKAWMIFLSRDLFSKQHLVLARRFFLRK